MANDNAQPALQYYPYPAQPNPFTLGQWVMVGAGVFAVTGLAYWGFRTWRRSIAPASNPVHQLHVSPTGAPLPAAPQYPQAA